MAPHGQFVIGSDYSVTTSPPVPAARHAHLFKDVKSKQAHDMNQYRAYILALQFLALPISTLTSKPRQLLTGRRLKS